MGAGVPIADADGRPLGGEAACEEGIHPRSKRASTNRVRKPFTMVCVAVEALRLTRTELLVLAVGGDALAAVDLNTGGLIRAGLPTDCLLSPFDIAAAGVCEVEEPDPAQPDAMELSGPVEVTGRARARKVERFLRPLLHPTDQPLLGIQGVASPYWTLCGDHPSAAVVDTASPLEIVRHGRRIHCFFEWRGNLEDLPLVDRRVALSMAKRGQQTLRIRRRFVVALTPPYEGNCYKVVAGLLPRR